MIYTTGTIAISGNTLTGTGTNFTAAGSLIRNGCTVIAMTSPVQVFQITAIGSATSLTVTPAASPAIPAGTKYAILLSDSLSVDGLAQDIAETFTMYQRYMSGFADVMNGTSDVTITINGVAVTVPGQKSLAKKGDNSDITSLSGLKTALSIEQGGTGAKNAADARTKLGLGNSATRDVDSQFSPGSAYLNGAAVMAQCHRDYRNIGPYDAISQYPLGMSFGIQLGGSGWGGGSGADTYTGMLTLRGWHDASGGGYVSWQLASTSQGLKYRQGNGTILGNANVGFSTTHTLYSTQNTTKASDGTLKAASPIARIVKSQEENQRTDVDEVGFTWCGCGTANAEAEGVFISRLDTGVYELTGSAGLASEGWQLLPPMDPGGMGELGVVEAEQTENGGLTIRLFKRKYMLSEEGEIVKTKGAPIDVPANSWIDVRLDMPDDSIWNTRSSEASLELTEQPAVIQP
ncbi:phage tail protein [Enterobacter hormaechei]|uniref:phage tail fiber protein n=2 Tax=Enterobacter hormaechei TaxID=158836 RepID=UPI000B406F56|nr:phage tail protein [Enterobacter hormaechei]EKU5350603.1 phage tail protein [Enterobacter hormaechei]ELD3404112.1 phage tail protein [Enterobacter hormaechei]RNT17297.1 phage tail protein [Enterobacter hormaechei subsp. xiangfangensis]RNU07863.1 phage tail protein [Enterobacter hormaechei subsp. xiangfangensis]RNU87918.1 phage tail protein [Enterobacter hormaechei subsp. xiangfangensis]